MFKLNSGIVNQPLLAHMFVKSTHRVLPTYEKYTPSPTYLWKVHTESYLPMKSTHRVLPTYEKVSFTRDLNYI